MMGPYTDRWYLGSLGALAGIIVVAAGMLLFAGSSGSAAPAASTAEPTTTATTTVEADPATLDFARALDLLAVREALSAYDVEHGAFPDSSGEIGTLCAQANDPGCALIEFNSGLKFGDGESSYWYASDGSTYTLIARAEMEQPDGQSCPSELPDALTNVPVMCMTGEGD
jgi:ABC-type transport system substrate-binding protein